MFIYPIPDFDDYELDCEFNPPKIWSIKRSIYLKPVVRGDHLSVMLRKDGKKSNKQVHRIIAEILIPNTRPDIAKCVDHANQDPLDNRIENLRWTTNAENNHNSNSKGYIPQYNRWRTQIRFEGKRIYPGTYDTEEEAGAVYIEASKKYYPGIRFKIDDKYAYTYTYDSLIL